ncbi:MAG: hypothetical protein ACLS48_02120 [[Eubacterium] siraeum]
MVRLRSLLDRGTAYRQPVHRTFQGITDSSGCVIVGLALFILGKIFKTKKRGYVMYKDSEACKEKNEAYYAVRRCLKKRLRLRRL